MLLTHVHFTLSSGALFGKRLMGLTATAKEKSKAKQSNKSKSHTVIEQPAVIPAKAGIQLLLYAFAVAFKSVPISVASQWRFCQGEMAMDGHFSFD